MEQNEEVNDKEDNGRMLWTRQRQDENRVKARMVGWMDGRRGRDQSVKQDKGKTTKRWNKKKKN